MILVTDIDVWGFQHAIRGMRNPMNSWEKSDSYYDGFLMTEGEEKYIADYVIGKADADLMHRLFKGGTEHRKFMRQIMVSMDITAPLYWWKEFDTYKVGTVANSCSTMHKIASKVFELDDFSHEHLGVDIPAELNEGDAVHQNLWEVCLEKTVMCLNQARHEYLRATDPGLKKQYWWQMIQLLPSSYNQKRTVTMNYEVAATIIRQRTGHKLDEWHVLVERLMNLPYMDVIINGEWGKLEYADNDTAQSGLSSAT